MRRLIHDFFTEKDSPVNLAVFRIVLFGYLLFDVSLHEAVFWSSLPADLRFPPPGLGFVLRFVPINPSVATAAFLVFVLCSFTAMIGFQARTSAAVVALTGVYLIGLANLYGKINHEHHLLWFAAILAASPCADAWSVDAFLAARSRTGGAPSPISSVYALPRRLIWLLFGLIYLGPGLWKLRSAGLAWAWSDNPKFILYNKWAEFHGWVPAFRIDHYPLLYKLGALGTLAFETSFIFLIFHPLLRPVAVLSGLLFHLNTYLTMRIGFPSLVVCYVVFIDWDRWLPASMRPSDRGGEERSGRRSIPALVVGGGLLAAVGLATATNFNSWPIARYPTFAGLFQPEVSVLAIRVTTSSGEERELTPSPEATHLPADRLMGLVKKLSLIDDPAERDRRLRAFWRVVGPELGVEDVRRVRVYRETIDTTPGVANPVKSRVLLREFEPESEASPTT